MLQNNLHLPAFLGGMPRHTLIAPCSPKENSQLPQNREFRPKPLKYRHITHANWPNVPCYPKIPCCFPVSIVSSLETPSSQTATTTIHFCDNLQFWHSRSKPALLRVFWGTHPRCNAYCSPARIGFSRAGAESHRRDKW